MVLVIAPAAGVPILAEYQQERLTAFLHPSDDPADSSYQINQALIAVGSGGKTGRGDDATQTQKAFCRSGTPTSSSRSSASASASSAPRSYFPYTPC